MMNLSTILFLLLACLTYQGWSAELSAKRNAPNQGAADVDNDIVQASKRSDKTDTESKEKKEGSEIVDKLAKVINSANGTINKLGNSLENINADIVDIVKENEGKMEGDIVQMMYTIKQNLRYGLQKLGKELEGVASELSKKHDALGVDAGYQIDTLRKVIELMEPSNGTDQGNATVDDNSGRARNSSVSSDIMQYIFIVMNVATSTVFDLNNDIKRTTNYIQTLFDGTDWSMNKQLDELSYIIEKAPTGQEHPYGEASEGTDTEYLGKKEEDKLIRGIATVKNIIQTSLLQLGKQLEDTSSQLETNHNSIKNNAIFQNALLSEMISTFGVNMSSPNDTDKVDFDEVARNSSDDIIMGIKKVINVAVDSLEIQYELNRIESNIEFIWIDTKYSITQAIKKLSKIVDVLKAAHTRDQKPNELPPYKGK